MAGMKVRSDVDPDELARLASGFSGAQIELACREAGMICVKTAVRDSTPLEAVEVGIEHFQKAIRLVAGSAASEFNAQTLRISGGNGQEIIQPGRAFASSWAQRTDG
jgi:SpoVK/Ycf46/Vps4 family AAA+-type ATPase